jgi:uncharacterized protein (DUF1501 family)
MNADYRDALLHEDLITPLHDHDEARNSLVATVPGQPDRVVTPAEAGRIVAELRPTPGLHQVETAPDGPKRVGRRGLLRSGGAGLGALLAASAGPRLAFAEAAVARDLLVVVFLRGGIDGLSAVVPVDDPAYYAARPKIGVRPENTFALDDRFGMNKNLAALQPMWKAGELAPVVGSGVPGLARSHFDDSMLCERAAPANVRSGWLGRHLSTSSTSQGTLRAVTIGNATTFSLTTNFETVATSSIADFDVKAWSGVRPQVLRLLDSMYGDVGGGATQAADKTLAAVGSLASLRGVTYKPAGGARYPDSVFGRGMAQIAQIAKSGKGLEVACIDIDEWDMHQKLGLASSPTDWFSRKARDLAEGLAALRTDLGSRWNSTTVVTMSEFGRRVRENGTTGLDHGTGNLAFVAGGSVNGGKVYGSLPSLSRGNLVAGAVPVTTDYRQALSEIVTKRLRNGAKLAEVFPGFTPGPALGIV